MAIKKQGAGSAVGIGVGIAALAAAAAGAYYFYGPDGTKNRKKLSSWSVKARGEVMEKMEKMKDLTEPAYQAAVTMVMDKYRKVKSLNPAEIDALAKELTGQWKRIKSHLVTDDPKKAVKKAVKKA